MSSPEKEKLKADIMSADRRLKNEWVVFWDEILSVLR